MRHRRAVVVPAFLALSVTAPSRPASALPPPNRLTAEVAPVTWGSYEALGSDGLFYKRGVPGISFYGEYGHAVTRWLELGAGVSYGKPYSVSLNMLRAHAFARAFGSFVDDSLEFGATLRLGPAFSTLGLGNETVFYLGGAAGLAVDVQYWLSEQVGVRAGVEAWIGPLDQMAEAEDPYFRDTLLGATSLAPTAGLSYRF